jgi:hypothetical protein
MNEKHKYHFSEGTSYEDRIGARRVRQTATFQKVHAHGQGGCQCSKIKL